MKIAYVFPGQGSQKAGMGLSLSESFSSAREVFETVDRALGLPLSDLCFEGPEEDLRLTHNTQPALLTVSAAAWAALQEAGPAPAGAFMAGHSLGEYSAHVAAGSLDVAQAAVTVRNRGLYMQEAVPVGEGAMAAILGMEVGQVSQLCKEAGDEVWLSNDNSPGQAVVGGRRADVEKAAELAKAQGAKKVVMLEVSAPFHTPLMGPAQERLATDLTDLAFAVPSCPIVCNVDAAPVIEPAAARKALVRQVTGTVRWTDTLEFLRDQGVEAIVEVGAGRVLSGLARRVSRDWKILSVSDAESVAKALETLTE